MLLKNKQGSTDKGGAWVLDQLNLEGLDQWTDDQQKAAKELLVASADVFSKDDLDLGKCNILKHDIKITDPQPFKERYRRIPPHLYEEGESSPARDGGGGGNQEEFQSMG